MYLFTKRILDIIIALLALIILSPIFFISILILLSTGEHYVFYFQQRIGYKNKPFKICKFATMLKDSPNMPGGTITLRKDSRVLPLGRFFRFTKINELPQIFNVLIGNMSIVGPRPLVEKGFQEYTAYHQSRVYNVKPGITGIGSIVFRDEEKLLSNTDMDPREYYRKYIQPYKGELELWYQDNASLWVDVKIIFLTAFCILFHDNKLHNYCFKNLPKLEEDIKESC